ncbi:DUF2461 domain-containing protein [Flexithrix dorotheae]|uniref:DUF2461 domain-containing protein n=1 Tax=Flexithrix dorotheae TaxID=70993 RepID=UPI0004760611|nr:DUF2461 domain-containing protein [Flexithrix dorotheae]
MNFESTLNFLSKLKDNNNKEWFDLNRKIYLKEKEKFKKLIEELITGISGFDPGLIGLETKHCIFRINRDIRFSNDKSPYKLNFGASMAMGGKKSKYASYYIHLQPGGKSFVGGGMYHPMPEDLKKVRQEIDYNLEDFQHILNHQDFKKYFDEIWKDDALKTAPKGYPKDHPAIELLKLKSFVVFKSFEDEEVFQENFKEEAIKVFHALYPFNQFLNVAVGEEA